MTRAPALALVTALAVVAGTACGDEEGGGGGATAADQKAQADAKKKAADKKKKEAERKKTKKKIEAISFVPTLETIVPGDEAKTIRRRLRERDFAFDGSGVENRDPFRSYVMPQLQTDSSVTGGAFGSSGVSVTPTEICTKRKLIATNYAMRDLALIGIVVRGAQRFALFRDAKGVGHMVERGKCLGREKALVTEIGDGHVTVEIVPEPIPNAPPAVPEKRSIPLYASEITVEDLEESEAPPADPSTVPAPPPVVVP